MNDDIEIEDIAPYLIVAITIIGFILRVMMLSTKGLWLDETFSIWMSSHSVGDMLHWIVKIDQHPPLYYYLFHFWLGLSGNSAYAARMFSVLFGTATLPVVYLIGKRMSGALVGLAAAAILAFSTFNVYFAQEARMYTMLMFNACVAVYALVRLLSDPRAVNPIGDQFRAYVYAWRTAPPLDPERKGNLIYMDMSRPQKGIRGWFLRHRWLPIHEIETDLAWVLFVVFTTATLYTHNTAIFLPVAFNIFVLGLILFQKQRRSAAKPAFQAPSVMNWIKAQVAVLVLWSPWIYFFVKQASNVYQRFWVPMPTWLSVYATIKSFFYPAEPISANVARGIWILFFVLLCLGLVGYRKKISQFLFLVCLFAVPILGELLVSQWRPIFLERTLIWVTLPIFLLLASGIAQLRFRVLTILVLGAVLTIYFFSDSDYYRFYQKEDWNTAARTVAGLAEDNDLVLFNSNFVEIPFDYYIESYETHQYLKLDKQGLPLDLINGEVLEPVMTEADVPDLLNLIKGHDRVFLVYSHDDYTDPEGLIPQAIASQMELVRTSEFYGGVVQYYVKP